MHKRKSAKANHTPATCPPEYRGTSGIGAGRGCWRGIRGQFLHCCEAVAGQSPRRGQDQGSYGTVVHGERRCCSAKASESTAGDPDGFQGSGKHSCWECDCCTRRWPHHSPLPNSHFLRTGFATVVRDKGLVGMVQLKSRASRC